MISILLIVGTFLKAFIALMGLGLTFWYFIKGVSNKDEVSKKKAMKFFLLTFGFVFLISLIEFLFAYLSD